MTMVELVARAIFESFQDTQDGHLRRATWESQSGLAMQPYYREGARAAIAAMREPTEAMIEAAGNIGGYQDGLGLAPQYYSAMIDASLSEGPPPRNPIPPENPESDLRSDPYPVKR